MTDQDSKELLERLRETPGFPQSLVDAVMRRVQESPSAPPRERVAHGHAALYILAAAAAVVVAVLGGVIWQSTTSASQGVLAVAPANDSAHAVRFTLDAPGVQTVALAGDFNRWDAASVPLSRDPQTGEWRVDLTLPEGRYTYAFVVDGVRWVADPAAPAVPDDGFGRPGSVIVVESN